MTDKNLFLKNYYFYGKHADMVDKLCSEIDKRDSNAKIFETFIDLFIYASLVGVFYDHRSKPSTDKSNTKNILAEQFNSHSSKLNIAFKFVTLLGNKDKYDEVTRLNKTFRNPETDENYIAFEEYMLGGLEEIYDKLMVETNHNYSDYLTSLNRMLSEFKKTDDSDEIELGTDDFF